VWTDVELTGLEAIWINFRQHMAPSIPNLVQPLILAAEPQMDGQMQVSGERKPCHYVYVAAGLTNVEELVALLRYTAQVQPQIGTSLEEAMRADQVTIVGSTNGSSDAVERQLRALGIRVTRFSAELVAQKVT